LGIKKLLFFFSAAFHSYFSNYPIFTAIRSTTQKELNVKNKQNRIEERKIKLEQNNLLNNVFNQKFKNITLQNTKKRKEEITLRLYELKKLISDDKNHLNQALTDLSETEEYKILRSEKPKKSKSTKSKKDIDSWKKIINQLEKRIQSAFI
jgi:hypothetical protein